MKRPSKEQPRTNPSAASPVEPASLWSATQSVEVPEGKTITEYLSQHGLQRGVELDQSVAEYAAASILRVEGGRKYEVGRLIAKGGMGVVNEAKDLNYRRTVAMKVLSKDVQSRRGVTARIGHQPRPEDLLRFIEEAQVTSQLEHPNIIPVHELGLDQDGNVFYTMKFVKGVTLTEVLDNVRRGHQEVIEQFPLGRLLTIFQKACDAVAFAHSKGVVHRDLKPDNIMIGDFGEVLVMDWGLAKVLRRQAVSTTPQVPMMEQAEPATVDPASLSRRKKKGEQDTSIDSIRTDTVGSGLRTISGRVMGTPGFMAPEQASARADDIDTRSDVYCMGAILYSILTLRPPVKTKNIRTTLRKIIHGDIPPPVSFNPPGPGAKARAKTKVRKPEKVVVLSHLPGGQIPVILSDIAMKAMSVNPVERYQTVQELQHDIEAYQEGLIWHLVVDEDFSDPDILSRWEVIGGQHEIKEGELRLYGGEPQILLLKKDVPGDVRIEFECRQESVYLNDVGCFVGAIRSANRKEIPSSGYELKYGGYDNSLNVLMRSNQKIWSDQASPLVRGKIYRVRAERIGSRLRMAVNNEDVFKVTDRDPLSGPDRTAVGLLGWMADTRYTRIRVYSLGTPWKSDILDTAERHLQKGHYVTAADLFKEVLDSYPDSDRLERAKKGYATARHRRQLMENLPESKEKLQRAWPSAAVQIRMDNDGLTVEITNAGITDLSPLKGLPLTSLYCAGNRIESLEPLRGMSLVTLNCSGNAIESLDALRGMPLTTLICECCRITSLEPLRGMALTMLNCGGNALANGLEPLRDMPLTWLSCWGNDLDALDPIADMKLSTLYMDANRVQSLAPLHGMPLATLHCNGNRIEDLEPDETTQQILSRYATGEIELSEMNRLLDKYSSAIL